MALRPHKHAHINPAPHYTKRFHVEDMRRVPVQATDDARSILDHASHQSRLLPQALAEFFGTLPDVSLVEVALAEDRLRIMVQHEDEQKNHAFFIAIGDLANVAAQPRQGFEAVTLAGALLQLYRIHILREEEA